VAGGVLHIAERHAGVQGGGEERVTQGVGPDTLGDPPAPGDATHDSAGGVAIDPLPVDAHEVRPVAAFADREVDGPGRPGRQRHDDDLATLRTMVSVR
jgi:hypothetical protein